ncbi:MAG TPA: DUF1778 domain-containing protein [Phycisphaerae bacterium]|jgi:uncharacterized protein (DUF1778 family)|nr:DUF1778 domain-containing protein [Phycisphaerae bacterium]HOB76619.1 DUF1778 domain-containing protein [Phycisphaerae bacterium]HOJ56083.1 DUF1778 domain-containing protein [Phycisphaerae bacterium]HOL28386.1 DUF1778 domain-containing protein [Phycisphaerae bacterium]HPP22857.1 DUF1778 domain-containing protein [Phycisphaerae bacterium]
MGSGYSKITIRQPVALKKKIERAAAKRGMTVTSFINSTLERAADRTLERVRRRELTDRDQAALLEMLTQPKGPNKALLRAAERYRERYGA